MTRWNLATWLSALLLMVCAPAGAQSTRLYEPQQSVTIPFTLERGEIYVPPFVNGRGPFRFRQINIGSALLARKECVIDLDQVKQLVRMRCQR